jgi:hypothetical protein
MHKIIVGNTSLIILHTVELYSLLTVESVHPAVFAAASSGCPSPARVNNVIVLTSIVRRINSTINNYPFGIQTHNNTQCTLYVQLHTCSIILPLSPPSAAQCYNVLVHVHQSESTNMIILHTDKSDTSHFLT